MEYTGKLYGKIGNKYFDTGRTSEEFDSFQKKAIELLLMNDSDTKHAFGRISESVFGDLKSLDDLITKMSTTKDGYEICCIGEPDDFKLRFRYFKEFLKKEIPELTEKEILKFDKHFQKFKRIYEWYGVEYFLTAMEYEVRNNSTTKIKPQP